MPGGWARPELLALLAAVAACVTLVYLVKPRRRRLQVPHAALWLEALGRRQAARWLDRLRRMLGWVLQLAVAGGLALAVGTPDASGLAGCETPVAGAPAGQRVVVLVDTSGSMGALEAGRARLDRAVDAAAEALEGLAKSPGHQVLVAAFDARTRPMGRWVEAEDTEAWREALDAVREAGPRAAATDVDGAVAYARAVLAATRPGPTADGEATPPAEVVLVATDARVARAAASSGAAVHRLPLAGEGERLPADEASGTAHVNLSVESFRVRPVLDGRPTYAAFWAVRHHGSVDGRGDGSASAAPLRAILTLHAHDTARDPNLAVTDGRIVHTELVTLRPGERAHGVLDDVAFEGSRVVARIAVAPDEAARDVLASDDLVAAHVPPRRPLRVQLVTAGNLFVEAALLVREGVRFESVAPADYTGPEGYDLTIFDGVGTAAMAEAPGRYLFVNPPDEGSPFEVRGVLEAPQIGRVRADHPLTDRLVLSDLNIVRAKRLRAARGDTVLVRAAEGRHPLYLARQDAKGDRVLVALAFDPRESLLPLSYAFPLLVVNVLNHAEDVDRRLEDVHRVDQPVDVALRGVADGAPRIVVGPGGGEPLTVRAESSVVRFTPDAVGFWEVRRPREGAAPGLGWEAATVVERLVAVAGAPVAESALPPWPPRATRSGEPADTAWRAPEPWQAPKRPWQEASPWRVLVLAALALGLLEFFAWGRRWTA